jgi:hypothetical protein
VEAGWAAIDCGHLELPPQFATLLGPKRQDFYLKAQGRLRVTVNSLFLSQQFNHENGSRNEKPTASMFRSAREADNTYQHLCDRMQWTRRIRVSAYDYTGKISFRSLIFVFLTGGVHAKWLDSGGAMDSEKEDSGAPAVPTRPQHTFPSGSHQRY